MFAYFRNNQNMHFGRHRRSVEIYENEIIHRIFPREISELLKISANLDLVEQHLTDEGTSRRHKRETVDHIGTFIQVNQFKFNSDIIFILKSYPFSSGHSRISGQLRNIIFRSFRIK